MRGFAPEGRIDRAKEDLPIVISRLSRTIVSNLRLIFARKIVANCSRDFAGGVICFAGGVPRFAARYGGSG